MRVAIAEDSGIFRQALITLLNAAGVTVTQATSNGEELAVLLDRDPPDAVIMDLHMPPTFTDEGIRAMRRIKAAHPRVGVLVLSAFNETPYAVALLEGGLLGVGYLLKDHVSDVVALQNALRQVVAGEVVIDPHAIAQVIAARRKSSGLDALSTREREVLALMAEGYSNAGIARRMHLSVRTVEDHVRAIFSKLDVGSDSFNGNPQDGNKRVLAVLASLGATRFTW